MDKRKKVFSVFGVKKKKKRKAIDQSKFFKKNSSQPVPFEYVFLYVLFGGSFTSVNRFNPWNNLLDFRIVVA